MAEANPAIPARVCELCGSPLRRSNLVGICSTRKECRRAKMERTRHPDGKPPIDTQPPCDPNGEIWKPAPAPYGSLYLVSNRGRVWSMHRHRGLVGGLLKPWIRGVVKTPKLAVTLYGQNGTKWAVDVHVLVMRTFEGKCPPGKEVRHLDGNAYRNWWPENLVYGTHKENGEDARDHGTVKAGVRRGESHSRAKLTEELVRQIRTEYAAGGTGERELAARYGVNGSTLHRLLARQTWTHVE